MKVCNSRLISAFYFLSLSLKIPDEQKRENFIETLQALEDLIRKTSSKDDMLVTGTRVAAENLPGFQANVKLPGFQVDVSLDSSQQSGRFVRAEQSIQVIYFFRDGVVPPT